MPVALIVVEVKDLLQMDVYLAHNLLGSLLIDS